MAKMMKPHISMAPLVLKQRGGGGELFYKGPELENAEEISPSLSLNPTGGEEEEEGEKNRVCPGHCTQGRSRKSKLRAQRVDTNKTGD